MSGICAVWGKQNAEPVVKTLASITRGLAAQAGENTTRLEDSSAGIGVAARFATQQIFGNDRVMAACDADLCNEADLWKLTGARCDAPAPQRTAALLAVLYERYGDEFVERLRGAFSVVLWDRRDRKLIAAIDGIGVNRLVYHESAHRLLIATRLDALVRSGEVDTAINPQALANVLNYTASLAPATVLRDVRRLEAGMMLIASHGRVQQRRFWDMRYGMWTGAGEKELSRQLEALVETSVRDHCKDDSFDEIGAFLSGGTDSSTVVGMMSRLGKGPARSFSIGFEEQPFNELGYAQIAASRFQSDHHTYLVGAKDCFEALPHMIRSFDEPYGNSSAIPTYFCARLAAQHGVKVLLAGDGGDELFGGNERYATDKVFQLYQRVPRLLRKGLIEPAARALPGVGPVGKARRYIQRSNLPHLDRYFSYHFLRANRWEDVFEKDFQAALGDYSVLEIPSAYYRQAAAKDELDRLLYIDMKITLADNDLPKVTCMSELAGIQTRFPFLAMPVAEFSGAIPAHLKVKGFEKRYLFKRAFRNLLPEEIIRKKKHGFGIPVAMWLKTDRSLREMAQDTLAATRVRERGYFKRQFLEDLFRKNDSAEDTPYYGDTLWTFFVMELWHRQVVDQPTGVSA
jgi:asparagine synthase (glutamine-hydrolysing)